MLLDWDDYNSLYMQSLFILVAPKLVMIRLGRTNHCV
jgi:hypothetical protein